METQLFSPVKWFLRPLYRSVRKRYWRTRGVPYDVVGQRLRFVLGTEPSYLRDQTSFGQEMNRRQLGFVVRTLQRGDVFVDVGAYIGLYSLLAAKVVGANGRVIAFEPYPGSRELLNKNVSLNGLADIVRVESSAIGDELGVTELRAAGVCSANTLTPNTVKAFGDEQAISTVTVSVTTLDEYCERGQIVPSFVKIDVEGWELHVLRGMERVLRGGAVVVCEMRVFRRICGSYGQKSEEEAD